MYDPPMRPESRVSYADGTRPDTPIVYEARPDSRVSAGARSETPTDVPTRPTSRVAYEVGSRPESASTRPPSALRSRVLRPASAGSYPQRPVSARGKPGVSAPGARPSSARPASAGSQNQAWRSTDGWIAAARGEPSIGRTPSPGPIERCRDVPGQSHMGRATPLFPTHRGARGAKWTHAGRPASPPLRAPHEPPPQVDGTIAEDEVADGEDWAREAQVPVVVEQPPQSSVTTLLGWAAAPAERPIAATRGSSAWVPTAFADDSELTAGPMRDRIELEPPPGRDHRWCVRPFGDGLRVTMANPDVPPSEASEPSVFATTCCVCGGSDRLCELNCRHAVCQSHIGPESRLRIGENVICPACGEIHSGTRNVDDPGHVVCRRKENFTGGLMVDNMRAVPAFEINPHAGLPAPAESFPTPRQPSWHEEANRDSARLSARMRALHVRQDQPTPPPRPEPPTHWSDQVVASVRPPIRGPAW